jgi:hypothetical protein
LLVPARTLKEAGVPDVSGVPSKPVGAPVLTVAVTVPDRAEGDVTIASPIK